MTMIDKRHDITLHDLTERLAADPALPLTFLKDGRPMKAGYHVTEVKAGQFAALDCGANPEAWSEIFVQLWDVDDDTPRGPMTAGRFLGIIGKVTAHVKLDDSARLTFEFSDGAQPISIFSGGEPERTDTGWTVSLSPRPASCKPRDRWLNEQERASTAAASASRTDSCCSGARTACC